MKLLPLVPALLIAAGVSAQMSMPRVDTRPNHKSTVELAYASVSADAGDYSGTAITARLYFYGNVFVTAVRNDASFDTGNLNANQFVYGLGTTEAWGQGTLTACYTHGKVTGDAPVPSFGQNIFSLGYELPLAQGLTAGLTVAHTLNEGDVRDVTATVFSARYELTGGLSVVGSYSAEDTLLGAAGASSTWTLGARYSF